MSDDRNCEGLAGPPPVLDTVVCVRCKRTMWHTMTVPDETYPTRRRCSAGNRRACDRIAAERANATSQSLRGYGVPPGS